MSQLFLIAIGGTGMRCLEAFTHLCATGMFDSKEIEVLTIDTDETNGNKDRTENLIRLYNKIKTSDQAKPGGNANSNTFFSAKINLYRFWTDYSGADRGNYRNLSKLGVGTAAEVEENKLLSDLFLDQSVQDFNLAHGYRAQTHLGSHLIYHAMIEAARSLASGADVKPQEEDFEHFFTKLGNAGANARVFVLGSVFGGTGASSIPVIPAALNDAMRIRSNGTLALDSRTKFGCTLLTEYFKFRSPDASQTITRDDCVIANSDHFSLNSQAALQFYQNDPTVQTTYKIMYHIGWPVESKSFDDGKPKNKAVTGGAEQRNPCHITELICACAAYDFFSREDGLEGTRTDILYKSFDYDRSVFNFDFDDFVGMERNAGKIFANRLGAFLSFAHIVLSRNKGAKGQPGTVGFLVQLQNQKIDDYTKLTEAAKDIDDYMKAFAYDFPDKEIVKGWIYQVRDTIDSGKFLFTDKAFSTDWAELEKIDVGALFLQDKYHWEKSFTSGRYNTFVNKLIKEGWPQENQNVTTTKEKFLAHIYNAITISHKNLI
jgi:hypothetical protein